MSSNSTQPQLGTHNGDLQFSPYGYTPTLYICIIYVCLFSIATLVHLGEALYWRLWWLIPSIVAGGTAELIGWAGRLWSSKDVNAINPFLMQITTTIMAPSFMTAANFIMLGVIISRLGSQYSRLSPKIYSIVFITADVVALVVQAVGGGMASEAAQSGNGDPNNGAHVMVGGILWQIVAMTVYVILALEFLIRVRRDWPLRPAPTAKTNQIAAARFRTEEIQQEGFGLQRGSKLSLMILALATSTTFIYIRSVYRTVELLDGWSGPIITTEVYFNVLDAMPVTLALFTIMFLHPGWLLYGRDDARVTAAMADEEMTLQGESVELVRQNGQNETGDKYAA